MANRINPQSIIPKYWYGVYVSSEEDLIFLGKTNLDCIKQYWHREERDARRAIKDLQSKIDLLQDKTVEDIKVMAEEYENPSYFELSKVEAIERKARFASRARYLTRIGKDAENKPALANHRPYDWFNLGDEVTCFISFEDAGELNGQFIDGKVVKGYRYHDGIVSVVMNQKVHENEDNHGGCGLGYGNARPEVMHKWEYEYLKANPDFFKVWLRASEDDLFYKFDATKLRDAITIA